jgi:hypothetical protein
MITFNWKRVIRKTHKKINLVLSTARTGSTWLFLHFHQDVKDICYEPYNSDDSRPEYKAIVDTVEFKRRYKDQVRYLAFLSQYGIVDMKLEITPKSVLKAVFKNSDRFNCAILRRRNMLQQYISRVTAHRSKVFFSEEKSKEQPLFVEPERFEAWQREINALYQSAEKAMKNCKTIYYEELEPSILARFFQTEIRFAPATAKLHTDYSFVENRAKLEKLYPEWKLPAALK